MNPTALGATDRHPLSRLDRFASGARPDLEVGRAECLASWQRWERKAPGGEGRRRTAAVRVLRECLDSGDCQLDLMGRGLTGLPKRLPDGIKTMRLANNYLKKLPDPLPATVTVLDASHNRLERLAKALPERMTNLTVANNRLTELPCNLPDGLRRLQAADNPIAALPETLPSCLTELYVFGAGLQALPAKLPPRLVTLDVAGNQLSALPALPDSLNKLDASNNVLRELPKRLPSCLRELWLDSNRLTCLPEYLPDSLKFLTARNNWLRRLPESVFRLGGVDPEGQGRADARSAHAIHVDVAGNDFSESTLRNFSRRAAGGDSRVSVIYY